MNISNLRPAFFYNALLNVGVNGAPGTGVPGLSSSLLPVTDGIGVLSPMSISTTAVNFDRSGPNTFQLDTIPLTVSATLLNSLATSTLHITAEPNQIKLTDIDPNTKKIGLADDIDGIHSLTTTNIGLDLPAVGFASITTNSSIPLILKPNGNNSVQIGSNISSNNLEIRGNAELHFYNVTGTSYAGWKAQASGGPNNVWELPTADGAGGQFLRTNGSFRTSWADATATTVTKTVTQIAHGLAVGNVIYVDTADSKYKKAKADAAATSEVVGIVSRADANTFDLLIGGICTPGAPLEPGKMYFLNPASAGGYTPVDPLLPVPDPPNPPIPPVAGHVSKPIFVAIDEDNGVWVNQRGIEIQ